MFVVTKQIQKLRLFQISDYYKKLQKALIFNFLQIQKALIKTETTDAGVNLFVLMGLDIKTKNSFKQT